MIALVSQSVNDSWLKSSQVSRPTLRHQTSIIQQGHFPVMLLIISKTAIMGASNYLNLHSVKETRPAKHV